MLQALREVDDQLAVLQALQAQAGAQARTRAASARAAAQQQGLLQRGLTQALPVLDARRRLIEDHLALVRTQAARRQATVALVQALGGGWEAPGATAPASAVGASPAAPDGHPG